MQNPSAPVDLKRARAHCGLTDENVHVWRGIPYAAPPVGEWLALTRPPERWDGVRGYRFFGLQLAKQRILPGVGWGRSRSVSEDCLYLNVWSPIERAGPLPVMVWLHGGGFTIGAGGLPPL